METHFNSRNKWGRPSSIIAPMTFNPYTTDDIHLNQNLPTFRNLNFEFDVPSIGGETFHSAPLIPNYPFGLSSTTTSTVPLDSNDSDHALPAEEVIPTSHFSASLGSRNLTTNPVRDQYSDPSTELAFPLYGTYSHGQYSDNGNTNASHGNFNGGSSHFLSPPTQPAAIF